MTNPTHRPEKKEKKIPRIPKVIGELAEKIVGKLYTPPPMSPKLLEQEKKRIMPLLEQFLDEQLSKKEEEVNDDWREFLMGILLENGRELKCIPVMEPDKWLVSIRDNIADLSKTVRLLRVNDKTQTKK